MEVTTLSSSGRQARRTVPLASAIGLAAGCGHTDVENVIHDHDDRGLQKMLADNPGVVNERGTQGWTPLIYAARDGNPDAVRILLDRGANANQRSDKGSTALMYAADNNRLTIAQLLIDRGADVNAADADGHTPLSFADAGRYAAMADLLKQHGARETGSH